MKPIGCHEMHIYRLKEEMEYSLDFITSPSLKRCFTSVRKSFEDHTVLFCALYVMVSRNDPMAVFTPIIIL